MPLVSVDVIPGVLEQISWGTITYAVLKDTDNQGKTIFQLAYNTVLGNEVLEDTEKIQKTKLSFCHMLKSPLIT